MKIIIEGDSLEDYLAKVHEAFRTGLRLEYDADVFGLGYPGYDPSISSYSELFRRYNGGLEPDLLIPFYEMVMSEPKRFSFGDIASVDCTKAIFIGDSWYITENFKEEFVHIIESSKIDYILSYFPMLLEEYRGSSLESKIIWTPPCIDPLIFQDWGNTKSFDVGFLAAGTTSYQDFYPERYQIHQKLLNQNTWKYLWAEHPGWGNHAKASPLVGANFSRAINSCKIFVTTAGRYLHPNPKYFEIMASGTCLFAQRPLNADELGLKDGVTYVEIDEYNILEKVDYYLSRPNLRQEIQDKSLELIRSSHTGRVRASDIITEIKRRENSNNRAFPKSQDKNFSVGTSMIENQESGAIMDSNSILQIPFELIEDNNHPQDVKLPPEMPVFEQSSAPQYTLYRLIRHLKPKRILEIGTQGGCSAVAMAFAQRDNGDVVNVTCIDPFIPCGDNIGAETLSFWHMLVHQSGYLGKGIDLFLSTSERFFETNTTKFDFIVVDGSHLYEFVKYDFTTTLAHSELGATIWLHDFMIYESVRNAVNEVVLERQLPFAVNEIQTNARGDLCGWAIARNWPYRHLSDPQDFPINLNLGCGGDYREGWVNIDADPNVKVDIRANFLDLSTLFGAGSVDHIEMIHSLGYLSLWDARDLFKQVSSVLKTGGKLVLEMPNIEQAIEKIQEGARNPVAYIEGVRAFHAFGLDQLEAKESYTPYAFSWTPAHLKAELEAAGFKNINILPPQTHAEWRDMRVEAIC